ncbi:MAG: gfo/Idh/MocA family oxidoreductase, partial [Chloroflexota bacterium]|nr:gfo/Idh/MocA family oxidoreductase [Chloroflexota bacterium]
MKPFLRTAAIVAALTSLTHAQQPDPPLRLAIAGLVHGHVSGFLRTAQARQDVQIVGVFDADAALLR